MKSLSDIKQLLKEIKDEPMRQRKQNKRKWYKIGKYLLNGNKIVMHKETQIAARRTYQYYSKIKGDWDGPSLRQLSKMKKSKFLDLLKGREEIEREILLTFLTLNQDHVTEDHADGRHVTENTHVTEDHADGRHVTENTHEEEDHVDRQHVTWNYITEDHGDGHHVTDITAVQKQPGDPGPAGERNINNRQDHGMINIEELLNDWLGEAV